MTDLEQALFRLGPEIAFPETPDVAGAVAQRLAERPPLRRLRRLPARRTLALAFAVLVVAVGLAMAVPPARTAILEFFGLRGATVERVDELRPLPDRVGRDLLLGDRLELTEAARRAAFDVLVPERLGAPDSVWYSEFPAGGRVSLVYRPREGLPPTRETGVGLLVTEFRGDFDPDFIGKFAPQATRVEHLTVGGASAIWFEGGPHEVLFRAPDGQVIPDTIRLAGNTLLLERGNVLVRLEGTLSRDEAVAIAESFDPVG
jgi:hypothetical protein